MLARFRLTTCIVLITMILVTTVGCTTATSSGKNEPTPTPIPPPPVPEKPTYTVKRGQVIDSLSFTGRVAPTIEKEMFFRESGRVKKVHVERNAIVEQGALLAELENDDLVRELTQTELQLETSNLNLKNAQESQDYAIHRSEISLELQKLDLAKLEAGIAASDNTTDQELARIELLKAENAYKEAVLKEGTILGGVASAERELQQARNDLYAAQAGRDSACSAGGPSCAGAKANVLNAELAVQSAEAALKLAQSSPSARDAAALDLQAARVRYAKATSKSNTDKFDVDAQKLQVKLAEMELEQLNKGVDPQLTKAVESSKLGVERLKSQVDNTRITSPIAGKVTSVSAYEGREVEAYRPVFVVADESQVEITAEPMSSQMDKLTEGMAAAIILSSYPGKELDGNITKLPYPYGTGGSSIDTTSSAEGTDKLTHIAFDPQDLKIEPGDLVKVIITLQKKEDALWLPPSAIRTFSGRKFVVVEEDGRQRRVDITVGIESAERVEIKDGLQENLVVVGQ